MAALEKGDSESFAVRSRRDADKEREEQHEHQALNHPTQTRVRRTLGLLKGLKGKGEKEIWTGREIIFVLSLFMAYYKMDFFSGVFIRVFIGNKWFEI